MKTGIRSSLCSSRESFLGGGCFGGGHWFGRLGAVGVRAVGIHLVGTNSTAGSWTRILEAELKSFGTIWSELGPFLLTFDDITLCSILC